MRSSPAVATTVAVLAVALLAGCGDVDELDLGDLSDRTVPASTSPLAGAPSDPAAGGLRREGAEFVDTCAVLTLDEVAAATGLTVIGSEEEPGFGCVWFVEHLDPAIIADDAITFRPFPAA